MRHKLVAYAVFMLGLFINTINAHAAPPSVAVDIAPLHSLVSQVMEGVSQPELLIPAEASPHHYTLRPSEAKALADAELVFWMGESYTPWLEKALNNVAGEAQKVEVLALEGTIAHGYREGATFESHDHGEEEGRDEKDHGESEKHRKDEHHDKHEKEEHADHHDHEGSDPHAWLDPENAKIWIKHISDILSKRDPKNASVYNRNATKVTASLDALIQSTATKIDALGKPKFIVFHDAYQYFEKRFDISATGSIALGHAQDPSPARIKEIRDTVKKLGVTCVFTEPQYNPGIVKNVFEGTTVLTIGVMDPLGASLLTGSDHYQKLIKGMVNSLSQCQ
ncbi:MAG: zinc ABC transporter substrate-binding protein [Cellvibrionaceae bacterium]